MECSYWWFGINNARKPKQNSHVVYGQIKSLLDGSRAEFAWPYHGRSRRFYEKMQPKDRILFWMGDGRSYDGWGIVGFGFIDRIQGERLDTRQYILKADYVPSVPLTPYPSGQVQETEETRFLREVFGLGFRPLGKTFNNLGYGTTRYIITIDEIQKEQYEAVFERVKEYPNVIISPSDTISEDEQQVRMDDEIYDNFEVSRLNATVRNRLQAIRIGQGRFRQYLLKYWKGRCSVTGFDDERILKASHIKPWRACDNFERLNPYNGLLLTPNLDVAFDLGLITFGKNGHIEISPSFQKKAEALGIFSDMGLRHFDRRHQKYLAYHRRHIFIAE